MIKELSEIWNIDLSKSVFIGDSDTDELCAKNSNIDFIRANCSDEISKYLNYLGSKKFNK